MTDLVSLGQNLLNQIDFKLQNKQHKRENKCLETTCFAYLNKGPRFELSIPAMLLTILWTLLLYEFDFETAPLKIHVFRWISLKLIRESWHSTDTMPQNE